MTAPVNPPGTKASRLFADMSINQEVWEEHLPQFATRLVATMVASQALPVWNQHDIARATAQGYKLRPEVLDSWTGQGFREFIIHVMTNYGIPVFSYVFGLDPELEQRIQLNSPEHIAGAARLAVLGAVASDVPDYGPGHGHSSKYDSMNAPQLDMKQGLRRLMMFARHQHLVGYLDFFDLEDETMLQAFVTLESKLAQTRVLTLLGPMLLEAQREGLDLGQCLLMWSGTLASPERVLEFVRGGIPLDYALMLTDGPSTR